MPTTRLNTTAARGADPCAPCTSLSRHQSRMDGHPCPASRRPSCAPRAFLVWQAGTRRIRAGRPFQRRNRSQKSECLHLKTLQSAGRFLLGPFSFSPCSFVPEFRAFSSSRRLRSLRFPGSLLRPARAASPPSDYQSAGAHLQRPAISPRTTAPRPLIKSSNAFPRTAPCPTPPPVSGIDTALFITTKISTRRRGCLLKLIIHIISIMHVDV